MKAAKLKDADDVRQRHGANGVRSMRANAEVIRLPHDEADEMEAAAVKVGLTMRRPSEIMGMEFDDSDLILGDRLLAEGQPLTILGQGGLGKSRLLLQLACCQITGRPFLGIPTHGRPRRWIIFQGENSNRRLQADLANLRAWIGEKDWPAIDAHLLIHTLETDADNDLCLEQCSQRIQQAIEDFKAEVACFDPLNNFSLADLNPDAEMRGLCVDLTRIVKTGNQQRAIVVLHHSIAGKGGAQKATGYDRSSFGRNSKALLAWTRAQINVAPGSAEDTDSLVIACGKSNNGREFETFAAQRDSEGVYIVDHHFDFDNWKAEISGKSGGRTAGVETVLAALESGELSRKALVAAIMEESGCGKSQAYNVVERAQTQRKIRFSKLTKTYETA